MSGPTMDTVAAPTEQLRLLTAADRCDRCGAQALIVFVMPSDTELMFCGHHTREHAPKLVEQGARVELVSKELEAEFPANPAT